MPYVALQSIVENANPPRMRNYWNEDDHAQLGNDVNELLVESHPAVPAP